MRDLKSKFFICSGLVTLLLFGQGCSDDKESDMPITIPSTEDTQPTLQKDGGSTTFSFNAPQTWSVSVTETTATRSASWLKVHPTSGAAGDATITITAEPNATGEPRTAEVTIRSGSQTETVTVTQDYSNFITLEQREIVAGSEEQTVTLDITSTME
ncbi:BACON domain-containing protein, partial [Bacteroides uniformis]